MSERYFSFYSTQVLGLRLPVWIMLGKLRLLPHVRFIDRDLLFDFVSQLVTNILSLSLSYVCVLSLSDCVFYLSHFTPPFTFTSQSPSAAMPVARTRSRLSLSL